MKKYRVEAFIIPSNGKNGSELNQIDDVKIAKKLKDQSFTSLEKVQDENDAENLETNLNNSTGSTKIKENDEQCLSDFSEIFFEIDEHIYDEIVVQENKVKEVVKNEKETVEYTKAFFKIEEPIYDEPFIGNLSSIHSKSINNYDVPQSRWTLAHSKFRRFGIVAPKVPKRSSSLKSILEDNESFHDTLQEICSHGRKNGCQLNNQRPEDISDEIFKENWMQRLDALRKLETLLKDKEVALQSRERLLFKKEKELRILERLVKDKMKQAELYAKRFKKSLSSESITNNDKNLESRFSEGIKDNIKSENFKNSSNIVFKTSSNLLLENAHEKVLDNLPSSKNSLFTDRSSNKLASTRSKLRPRQKIRYDDLDSTLSADIGDASFVITSKKFDPEIFKRPSAFARSASERRTRVELPINAMKLTSVMEKDEHLNCFRDGIEEKTLKKISDNILASQDQETKFLNYGLIDEKSLVDLQKYDKGEVTNQKRFSYLNLESATKVLRPKNVSKERPISWNEDADDWLKKKREAYNMSTRKIPVGNTAEKENFDRQSKTNKSINVAKKKETRKKFSIFR